MTLRADLAHLTNMVYKLRADMAAQQHHSTAIFNSLADLMERFTALEERAALLEGQADGDLLPRLTALERAAFPEPQAIAVDNSAAANQAIVNLATEVSQDRAEHLALAAQVEKQAAFIDYWVKRSNQLSGDVIALQDTVRALEDRAADPGPQSKKTIVSPQAEAARHELLERVARAKVEYGGQRVYLDGRYFYTAQEILGYLRAGE